MFRNVIKFICLTSASLSSVYAENDIRGYIAVENDIFLQNSGFTNQRTYHPPSVIFAPEMIWQNKTSTQNAVFEPFVQLSATDHSKTRFDIRRADYLYASDNYEIGFGISKIFWGVTESRHLVDIINQTDMLGNIEGEDKLGQPMLRTGLFTDYGDFRFFLMPYFRAKDFPHKESRLRPAFLIDKDKSVYAHSAQEFHPDIALRYEHSINDIDIGLHYFHGTDREPVIRTRPISMGFEFYPFYELIDRTGIDLQYTTGSWLFKNEMIHTMGHGNGYSAISSGFEYTFFGVMDTDTDIGLLSEYHYDDRTSDAPATFYDRDIFFGMRITPNDIQDTTFLAGTIIDTKGEGNLWSLEVSRRFGDNIKASLEARLFHHHDNQALDNYLDRDDFIRGNLSYYF